jgi:MFS family permease
MYVIFIGKVLFGLAMGGYTVYVPNFMNETVPTETKGPLMAFLNSMVAVGILLPALLGLAIPDEPETDENINSFYV